LSGMAYENIANSQLAELIVTDSIPLDKNKNMDKINVLSVAKLFADVLHNLMENKSISSVFIAS